MRFPRASGILLHVSSLPGEFGIGDMGESANRFVDFLCEAGQSVWQLLPLTPPARGDSPYSSYSATAGNDLLISPRGLADDGLLSESDLATVSTTSSMAVDYNFVRRTKTMLLRTSCDRFLEDRDSELHPQFQSFCKSNRGWLDDFARFSALRNHLQQPDWTQWEPSLTARNPDAISKWDDMLRDDITHVKFLQFVFFRQWTRLKSYANERGVRLFGDMPIFVDHQSADVWANQDLFHLNSSGRPSFVAGVPPDYFSETGQLWGNPVYCWDRLAATDYDWWVQRFRAAFTCFDLLRIDHFRGFESYWAIPASARTAIEGNWRPGPGDAVFRAAQNALGELPIVAEDLGMITASVHALRDKLHFPGMRVLQFGYDRVADAYHRPDSYPEHSVAYTGTHDNETIVGWYRNRRDRSPDDPLLNTLIDKSCQSPHLAMIRAVLDSASDTTVFPLQDLLGLGNTARMNTPGQAEGNWTWRCTAADLNCKIARELRAMTEASNRCS